MPRYESPYDPSTMPRNLEPRAFREKRKPVWKIR